MYDNTTRTAPWRTAAADHLAIRRCGTCTAVLAPMTVECSFCRSLDLEWVPATGIGTVVSWRLTQRPANGRLRPLVIGIVELDEGPWLYSTIEGDCTPEVGSRVQFVPQPPDGRFPVFAITL